jgi:hypothetical protein
MSSLAFANLLPDSRREQAFRHHLVKCLDDSMVDIDIDDAGGGFRGMLAAGKAV